MFDRRFAPSFKCLPECGEITGFSGPSEN